MSISWGLYRSTTPDYHPAAETKATNNEERMRRLEDKLDSLALLCQAQWESRWSRPRPTSWPV